MLPRCHGAPWEMDFLVVEIKKKKKKIAQAEKGRGKIGTWSFPSTELSRLLSPVRKAEAATLSSEVKAYIWNQRQNTLKGNLWTIFSGDSPIVQTLCWDSGWNLACFLWVQLAFHLIPNTLTAHIWGLETIFCFKVQSLYKQTKGKLKCISSDVYLQQSFEICLWKYTGLIILLLI